MIRASVITDASFYKPNGKSYGWGGWAAWCKIDGRGRAVKGYGVIKDPFMTNSTDAEVYAALNGIWLAARHGGQEILVRSDCMTVQDLIHKQVKAPRLLKIWNEAFARPDMAGLKLRSRHVKGHGTVKDAASWVNDWCDKHAGIARKEAQKGRECLVIS